MSLNLGGIFKSGAEGLLKGASEIIHEINAPKEERERAATAIQELQVKHLEAMQALATKEIELEYQDRASARTRESEFVKATGHADYFQYFIGSIAVLLTVAIIIFLLNKEVPAKNEHVIMLVVGEILGITASIFTFYFGSSQGSRNKDRKP